MGIEIKIQYMELLIDPIPNSLNLDHKNCVKDGKENYKFNHRSRRVNHKHHYGFS